MDLEKTICFKVDKLQEMLEKGITLSALDIPKMAKMLHRIRRDAQTMETALKLRKKLMQEKDIEALYKEQKKKLLSPTKLGTNTIANLDTITTDKMEFEVRIKQKGEIVYDSPVHSVIASIVEEVTDIKPNGEIEGRAQKLWFGHDVAILFGYDQLRQAYEERKADIITRMKIARISGQFSKPAWKNKLLDGVNQK